MHSDQGSTALLAQWAAQFSLESAPDTVVQRMKALVLDYFRVVAVGARLPWSRAARARPRRPDPRDRRRGAVGEGAATEDAASPPVACLPPAIIRLPWCP